MLDKKFIRTETIPKALLILLPCMGGNIMIYRYPIKQWLKNGFDILLLNPPGHGKSEGIFNFENTTNYLKNEIDAILGLYDNQIPLFGIGHSAGGSTLLNFFHSQPQYNLQKLFLLSPILNTSGSLLYLYKNKKIEEFINSLQVKDDRIKEIILNDNWLVEKYWKNENLEFKINAMATESNEIYKNLGTFLENIFIPTKTFHSYFQKLHENTILILPEEDIWYPIKDSIDTSKKYKFPYHIIKNAKNHFFKNSWKDVSSKISEYLFEK